MIIILSIISELNPQIQSIDLIHIKYEKPYIMNSGMNCVTIKTLYFLDASLFCSPVLICDHSIHHNTSNCYQMNTRDKYTTVLVLYMYTNTILPASKPSLL